MQSDIETEIQTKGLTAPRVTEQDVEREIESEWYINGATGVVPDGFQPPPTASNPLNLLTFCVLVLKNGFTVTGESACASPENYDQALGRKIARRNATSKVWAHLGFRLRDKISGNTGVEK